MQTLMDHAPNGYYTHNTGGEHATRVDGDENYVNQLRLQHNLPASDIRTFDYAMNHDGYVMLHQVLPDDPNGARSELAGYVLARKTEQDDFGFSFTIDDLLVDSELRGCGLGSFLLGKLATKGEWSMRGNSCYYPKSLLLPTDGLDDPTRSWFEAKGFAQDDSQLRLQLPGFMMLYVPEAEVDRLVNTMPANWYGSMQIDPRDEDSESQTNVYRQGQFVGHIVPIHQPATYVSVNGTEVRFGKYSLHPVDAEPIEGAYSSDFFAVVDLLNH